MPRASENAPKTITSEYRLMFGQMMMTTPSATERAPLMPSAQRTFVTCVSTRLPHLIQRGVHLRPPC